MDKAKKDKPKAGHICAAKTCHNRGYQTVNKSYFRFPTDPKRARVWALASQREDLLSHGMDNLWRSYRLCSDHFEKPMFTNHYCNRLNPSAVPTLFALSEGRSNASDHNYGRCTLVRLDDAERLVNEALAESQRMQEGYSNNLDYIHSKLTLLGKGGSVGKAGVDAQQLYTEDVNNSPGNFNTLMRDFNKNL
ncbi:hypothetical protein NQ315_012342 [Exocentrus adspersus]|uniref:THAP-type domain-containing protein n=1 Tax=Exocentrus adspersus TaxID=1586481 RepID=A0AAV8V8C6_9CUCU|nr:hypothetical protein NQ315_012342 [Exocentrus adspersus]